MLSQSNTIDDYIKPRRKKKIISSKKIYSAQKRNREDLLESTIVENRFSKVIEKKTNQNYGTYTT